VTSSTIERMSVLASHKLGIIDTDVHPLRLREQMQAGSGVLAYLPERWRNHVAEVGVSRAGGLSVGKGPRSANSVGVDQSIAEAVEAVGVAIETSCREGTCGTCETTVLGCIPDHRDSFLAADERAANDTIHDLLFEVKVAHPRARSLRR
jgi:hypothetical protein